MPTFKNEVTGNDEHAIVGVSPKGRGMVGWSETAYGVSGESQKSAGIRGTSVDGRGTEGWSTNSEGVVGISTNSTGIWGQTEGAEAVGVLGTSKTNDGVRGISTSGNGVSAFGGHTGIYAKGPVNAGYFDGNIHATGNITTAGDVQLFGADCAEDFDIADADIVEPGTVMVLGKEGILQPCQSAYDKRVTGVISGAGDYKPGIVLDKQQTQINRRPIALLGKVFCKVDASFAPIEVGDLLTTSDTAGHAMKADDPIKAFGAVIGKALSYLKEGQGLIPILIALQ